MTIPPATLSARAPRPDPAEGSAKLQIKEYKESLVIEAAATLFYERGFQGTTLDDIAAALGVTKPFIYTYFKSKYDLLERLFDRVYDEFYRTLAEFKNLPETDPVLRFEYFVGTYAQQNMDRRQFTALMLQEEKNLNAAKQADMLEKQREFDKLLPELITDGVRAGVFHVEDVTLTALSIAGMIRWIHRWYTPDRRLSDEKIRRLFVENALRLVGYVPAMPKPSQPPPRQASARRKPG
ncbi:TetR/AcrR family transcriptional regulator [Ramlibacter henchirensis]|uniref:TetR/AcrR family transcriptional regulator n=1 Tax=Ramlibacter henchirensis TaxID=204072 RepID=A0A4Z0BUE2_9BURK|nr:TetR/AcrR family transcriptional regulator [Ramlibacter henchirensis]TFZ02937.1 TetR/AcrR family transcriptional regulator [Ramlibacter henchirensis]